VPHVARGHELTFLHVDGAAGLGGGHEQIGLTGEERRNLQQLANVGHGCGLVGHVDVGRNGQPDRVADLFQDSQPFFHSRAAKSIEAGAIRLVERGLEDELHADVAGVSGELLSDRERQRFSLDHTGSRDHQQRFVRAAAMRANLCRFDCHVVVH